MSATGTIESQAPSVDEKQRILRAFVQAITAELDEMEGLLSRLLDLRARIGPPAAEKVAGPPVESSPTAPAQLATLADGMESRAVWAKSLVNRFSACIVELEEYI